MSLESSTQPSMTAEGLLRDLGSHAASGVLEISHPSGTISHVWAREGCIYAMQVPGYRPALGIRLLSGGLISPEQLSTAAAEQRNRFPKNRIGEVLVGLGFVTSEVIDAFVLEQVHDQIADLLDLPVEGAAFHPGRLVRQDVIAPTDVEPLLEVARERRAQRADILAQVGGQHVVPTLGPPGRGSAHTPLGPYDWALLCRVDGRRDVTELARVCGFTLLEAAQVVSDLAATGLVELPRRAEPPAASLADVVPLHPEAIAEPEPAQWSFVGTDAGEPVPVLEHIPAAAEPGAVGPESGPAPWVEAQDLLAEFSAFVREQAPAAQVSAPPAEVPAVGAPDGTAPAVAAPVQEAPVQEAPVQHDPPSHAASRAGGHPLLVTGGGLGEASMTADPHPLLATDQPAPDPVEPDADAPDADATAAVAPDAAPDAAPEAVVRSAAMADEAAAEPAQANAPAVEEGAGSGRAAPDLGAESSEVEDVGVQDVGAHEAGVHEAGATETAVLAAVSQAAAMEAAFAGAAAHAATTHDAHAGQTEPGPPEPAVPAAVPAATVPAATVPAPPAPVATLPALGSSAPASMPADHGGGAGAPAPSGEGADSPFNDTSLFMRELSSLSDDPDKQEPVVTRLVVPLTEPKRKRRLWGR